jgi:hypothetical protein
MEILTARQDSGRMRILLACLTFAFVLAGTAYGAARTSLELAIKATFLYKFAPFVEWPAAAFETPASAVNICLVGSDPFGATIDQALAGQRVAGRPFALHRLAAPAPRCHIAYIAGDVTFVARALDTVRGAPVLTVTDSVGNAPKGIINFVIVGNHVRFDIDEQAAARNGLTVSSKLLSLARSVRPRA